MMWLRRARTDRDSAADFLGYVDRCLRYSHSQRFQDLFALWECGLERHGYFAEFGAMNGIDFSNTFMLERLGWSGVVAEPHPRFAKPLARNRSCTVSTKCVFERSGETVTFHAVEGRAALSTIEGFGTEDERSRFRENYRSHQVETITLQDLLVEAGAPDVVDYLSIDTEGSERVILGSYDFESRPIRVITVEHNEHQRDDLYELLTGRGYRRKWPELSGHDDWYVHRDLERDVRLRPDRFATGLKGQPEFEHRLSERIDLLDQLRQPAPI